MAIKALIFDLDDTLYDCTGLLLEAARLRAAKALVEAGMPCTPGEAYRKQLELESRLGPRGRLFELIAETYNLGPQAVRRALDAYNSDEVDDIEPFPETIPTLQALRARHIRLFLVTDGVHSRQQVKIRILGLEPYFDEIIINDSERGSLLEECYEHLLRKHGLQPDEVLLVGDRIHVEIKAANTLGIITCRLLHGRYSALQPHHRRTPRIVVIGGGTGLPMALEGLKAFSRELVAIVAVTDTGRSSGRLRNDLGVLPPGDIRNCLVALSSSEQLLNDLFQYRFDGGSLEGMSFGNLFIAALAKVTGSFEQAIREVARVLAIEGRVLPATLADIHLCATLADGTTLRGELEVRKPAKPPIREVFLSHPDVEAFTEATDAIETADLIVLGPGSLYTSVITNLLVPGIARAIRRSPARKVYVCNVMTQPGQTDGYRASDHAAAIIRYLGAPPDAIVVNTARPPDHILARYRADGAELVEPDPDLYTLGPAIVEAQLVEPQPDRPVPWEKQDLLRHDPKRLASALIRQLGRRPRAESDQ